MSKAWLERVGVAATTACALHCAVTPFLVLLPLAGLNVLADEPVEWLLISTSFALGALNLIPDYLRHHRRMKPLAIFALGFALVLTARLRFEDELRVGTFLAVLGASLILGAYGINRSLCRACEACQSNG